MQCEGSPMCGRFTNQFTSRELVELYRITEPYLIPPSRLRPRFNFAPTDTGPVVRLDREGRRQPVMTAAVESVWERNRAEDRTEGENVTATGLAVAVTIQAMAEMAIISRRSPDCTRFPKNPSSRCFRRWMSRRHKRCCRPRQIGRAHV